MMHLYTLAGPLGRHSRSRTVEQDHRIPQSENRVRRFGRSPHSVEGLLILGDAVFTMDPVYALGMTTAAVSSSVLQETLEAHQRAGGVEELAVRNEWRWPQTEISDNTEELYGQVA